MQRDLFEIQQQSESFPSASKRLFWQAYLSLARPTQEQHFKLSLHQASVQKSRSEEKYLEPVFTSVILQLKQN